jgi:formylglycine-generating enzyme
MSLAVTGGTYFRTYDHPADDGGAIIAADGGPTGEADPATVSSFRLDKYLVTVGRFRQFVKAWNGGAGWLPPAGSGKHGHLNNGNGLNATAGGFEPGWVASDNGNIAPTNANLDCDILGSPSSTTWTTSPGGNESRPINCANWWEAYAFCIWDGAFLPSEAEWEYAAAGGGEQRKYPWGSSDPGTGNEYAIYNDYYFETPPDPLFSGNIAPVGTATLGAGRWGQLDLAGNGSEWLLDWHASYVNPCTDCADLTPSSGREVRGGSFGYNATGLLPTNRASAAPSVRGYGIMFRCARTP